MTCSKNFEHFPSFMDDGKTSTSKIDQEYLRFSGLWDALDSRYHCLIIQNNFEAPDVRYLGNLDRFYLGSPFYFTEEMNKKMFAYSMHHSFFHIFDFQNLQTRFGSSAFFVNDEWCLYKLAVSSQLIPTFAYRLSTQIASLFGRRKKVLVLDLDNTIWGGVIGEVGVSGIALGPNTPSGEAYLAFQRYLCALRDTGVLLAVASKNDFSNAISGLNSEYSLLKPSDFASIKANWENKSDNLMSISKELNVGLDSFVFIDDNPAEIDLVSKQLPMICTLLSLGPSQSMQLLSDSGFFETPSVSKDDQKRNEMYQANIQREQLASSFASYRDYLVSLSMVLTMDSFSPKNIERVVQLCNKTNQFNLTTIRYTEPEIEAFSKDPMRFCFCSDLTDKFGDNGIISVFISRFIKNDVVEIETWLMSCRVFKRDVELAVFNYFLSKMASRSIKSIIGRYSPTEKNKPVASFYRSLGFSFVKTENSVEIWSIDFQTALQKKGLPPIEIIEKDSF